MKTIYKSLFILGVLIHGLASASEIVTPAVNQATLLKSSDASLVQNKKLVYDFTRIVLVGRRLDQASTFLKEDYIQHNPNVETGLKGFLAYFSKLSGPKPIPQTVPDLVAIQAENDMVTLSFVSRLKGPKKPNIEYTTTWFDMFRIKDGKIAEHWDCNTKI